MLPEMGPPVTEIFEYPRGDESWKLEMEEFYDDILEGRQPNPGLKETIDCMKVVETLYAKIKETKDKPLRSL